MEFLCHAQKVVVVVMIASIYIGQVFCQNFIALIRNYLMRKYYYFPYFTDDDIE